MALVASVTATPGSVGGTTAAIDTTGASLIVVSVACFSAAPTQCIDNKGNTYTALTTRSAASSAVHKFYYAANPTVGPGHTFSVNANYPAIIVYAFSGIVTVSPFDGETGAIGTSPLAAGALTPSVDGALIVTGYGNDNSSAISISGGSFTQTTVPYGSGNNMTGAAGYLVQGTAAAITPTWTWTGPGAAVAVAAFKTVAALGTLASTLGDLTGTSTGTVATAGVSGDLAVTLGAVTGTAAGTVESSPVLVRAQSTGKVRVDGGTSISLTFGTAPALGNGVIVLVYASGEHTWPADACTDNRGNTWALAVQVAGTFTGSPAIYYCGSVAFNTAPFTITLTPGFGVADFVAAAVEYTGPGSGLSLHRVSTSQGISTTVSGGAMLTVDPDVNNAVQVAVFPINAAQTSIAVVAAAPAWVEEFEELPASPYMPGEGVSRVLTSAGGTSPAVSWTVSAAGWYATAQAIFSVAALLVEQTFEDGAVSHPLTWITLTKKDGSKHPYSEVDLNDPEDYYDGYKRPRVERFLTIARGLSDRDGQIEHMSFGALLSDIATDRFDQDREFRGLLADPVNKYLTNRPLEVWFIDDVERRRLGLARLAAVGYVNDYAPSADLHFELKGADWLKKKFSRKRRAQQGWQPLITAADFPACPDATLNSPAPLIYGSLGLGGADAVLGVTVTVDPQLTAAPGSFAVSLQAGGRLSGITRYYIVAGIVGGQETIQAGPLSATTTETDQTIRLTWSAVPGATAMYVYSSHRPDFRQFAYTVLAGGATSYDDTTTPPNQDVNWLEGTDWILGLRLNLHYYVYANLGGGLFSAPGSAETYVAPIPPDPALMDRTIQVAWTAHAGATDGYRVIRYRYYYTDWAPIFDRQWDVAPGVLTVTDDVETTTAVTVPSGELIAVAAAGQAEAIFVGVGSYGTSPITVSAFLIARHACARVGAIYVPGTTANVDGETATTYIAVPNDQYGVSWFAPDHPGWIYPQKYVEINGQWFTLIFTTVAPVPEKVLVDVDGIDATGDGTGPLLRSLVDQRLHFMVNFVAPDPAWASGPYLTAADTVFPHIPEIPLVDEASHALVKAQLAARLASGDYEGALILGADGEFITALDALARFQLSGDFDQTFNRKGQDMVTCEPIEAAADPPAIGDVLSIREGSFNLVDQVQSAFFNILPYVHSRDYTGRERTGWYGNNEIRSVDSIANYDQEREAPRVELHAGRANTPQGAATIEDVMARKLARYQDPRRIGSLQMSFEGLNYEPGSTAAITHLEGIGADGWSGREVRIIRHEVEPTAGIVRLDFYDLTAVLENHDAVRRRRDGK